MANLIPVKGVAPGFTVDPTDSEYQNAKKAFVWAADAARGPGTHSDPYDYPPEDRQIYIDRCFQLSQMFSEPESSRMLKECQKLERMLEEGQRGNRPIPADLRSPTTKAIAAASEFFERDAKDHEFNAFINRWLPSVLTNEFVSKDKPLTSPFKRRRNLVRRRRNNPWVSRTRAFRDREGPGLPPPPGHIRPSTPRPPKRRRNLVRRRNPLSIQVKDREPIGPEIPEWLWTQLIGNQPPTPETLDEFRKKLSATDWDKRPPFDNLMGRDLAIISLQRREFLYGWQDPRKEVQKSSLRCVYCHDRFDVDEVPHTCAGCGTVRHQACVEEGGVKCPTLGCPKRRSNPRKICLKCHRPIL